MISADPRLHRTAGPLTRRILLALPLLYLGSTAAAQAPKGVVYVESNTPTNRILAFQRDDKGHLAPLAGSPFPTGGAGVHAIDPAVLGPFDSDQNLITNPDRTRLFAVNSGSDTITIFDIRPDGSLVAVEGSPFTSGGVDPVSLGLAGDILIVANKDYDLGRRGFNPVARKPNYTTFRVDSQGRLTSIPCSTIIANPEGVVNGGVGPGNTNPSQVLVSDGKAGTVVFDADFFGLKLHSFLLQSDGRLRRGESQYLPAGETPVQGVNPLGLAIALGLQVHPKESILYVPVPERGPGDRRCAVGRLLAGHQCPGHPPVHVQQFQQHRVGPGHQGPALSDRTADRDAAAGAPEGLAQPDRALTMRPLPARRHPARGHRADARGQFASGPERG
jgi:hypothetical protein